LLHVDVSLFGQNELFRNLALADLRQSYGCFPAKQFAPNVSDQLMLTCDPTLELLPVRGESFGAKRTRCRNDFGDLHEWHIEASEHDHQPRGRELTLAIPAIASAQVYLGRFEQPDMVIQPQRLHR
jgi:hypothetical protein